MFPNRFFEKLAYAPRVESTVTKFDLLAVNDSSEAG